MSSIGLSEEAAIQKFGKDNIEVRLPTSFSASDMNKQFVLLAHLSNTPCHFHKTARPLVVSDNMLFAVLLLFFCRLSIRCMNENLSIKDLSFQGKSSIVVR